MIPYSRQEITEEDIDSVVAVLRSDFLTQGPVTEKFEQAIAGYCGVKASIATCNATAALHLACLALGVNEGDCVWVPAISFVATANCARYCGADVDFIDVDSKTGLICLRTLEQKFEKAQSENRLPKLLIVVHLAGHSVAMKSVHELCKTYGVKLVEDASHALGGRYQNQPVGSCAYSDAAVFSFHPVKPLTTGEGGMLLSNDHDMIERARCLSCHGIVKKAEQLRDQSKGAWNYEQQMLGFNYRLSDIHSALGLSQLSSLNDRIAARQNLASRYDDFFEGSNICPIAIGDCVKSAWHLYPVLFETEDVRNNAFKGLRALGYWVNVHYEPIPAQPYYQDLGFKAEEFPGALAYSTHTLSLPLFGTMPENVVKEVANFCLGVQ